MKYDKIYRVIKKSCASSSAQFETVAGIIKSQVVARSNPHA